MRTTIMDNLVGYVVFPASNYLMNRKGIIGQYREFTRSEWFREDVLRHVQFKKLSATLEQAARHVPFYRERFRKLGLQPGDIRSLDDIRLIPALTRSDLMDAYREMVDERFAASIPVAEGAGRPSGEPIPLSRFRRHKLVRNTSSGSTGAPTVFFEDGSRTSMNWACEMRLKKWFGIGPGAREARMARLATAYLPDSRSLNVRKHLWHQLILPGTNLAEEEFALCIEKMRAFRPRVLWGYTSALTGLADYVRRNKIDTAAIPLQLAISWAAPLYGHEERLLRETFGCGISNIYGAREVGHIAALCPAGGLHVNQEYLLVESEPASAGAAHPGELLVTTLDATPMPFIRYRMGDVAEVAPAGCGCGRQLQLLKNLLGRTGEIFHTKSGRMISPNFWCRVFMSSEHADRIRRFQVVYTREKNLRIAIQRGDGYDEGTEWYIRSAVADNFTPDTELAIVYVDRIEPTVSGKYLMVINEAKQQEATWNR